MKQIKSYGLSSQLRSQVEDTIKQHNLTIVKKQNKNIIKKFVAFIKKMM